MRAKFVGAESIDNKSEELKSPLLTQYNLEGGNDDEVIPCCRRSCCYYIKFSCLWKSDNEYLDSC